MALGSRSRSKKVVHTKVVKNTNAVPEPNDERTTERAQRFNDTTLRPEHKTLTSSDDIEICWSCLSSVVFINEGHKKCYRCGYPSTGKLIYKRIK